MNDFKVENLGDNVKFRKAHFSWLREGLVEGREQEQRQPLMPLSARMG